MPGSCHFHLSVGDAGASCRTVLLFEDSLDLVARHPVLSGYVVAEMIGGMRHVVMPYTRTSGPLTPST